MRSSTLCIIKLTAIILLAACLKVSANSYSKGITLSMKNVTLEKVFEEIKKQSGYYFLYNNNLLQQAKKVDVEIKDATIEQAMEVCLKGQPLTYAIVDNLVVIKSKGEPASKPPQLPQDTTRSIKGKVMNEKGEAVPGVTIAVKGSGKGSFTNDAGEFSITNIAPDATLLISSVGYEAQEVSVKGKASIEILLKTATGILDETVVIAYGTTTRRLSTGNISTVKAKDIEKQPVNNLLLTLQGRVPGLFITQNTGIPGGGITVRLQGRNSLNRGSDPLYVVDGVPYISQLLPNISSPLGILGLNGNTNPFAQGGGGNPLSFINPADIESIDILKDADATAIYGSRAANGAILITTKKGKTGRTKVDVNFQTGWGKVTRMLDLLNTQQYLAMRHEAKANDGEAILPTDYDINGTWDTTRYTNWQKALIGETAHYTDAQVSVSGGNTNTQFLVGVGYHRETTVFPGDLSDQKGSLHLNINHASSNQKFHFQLDGKYLVDNNQLINTDLTQAAVRLAPNAPALYNADGTLNWAPLPDGTSPWFNPLAHLYRKYRYNNKNLISNALISYQILSGLELKSSFGYSNLQTNETSIYPFSGIAPETRVTDTRYSLFGNSNVNSWIIEPQLTYKQGIGKGALEALVGTTLLRNNSNLQHFFASGFNSDQVLEDIKSAATLSVDQSLASVYRYNALFARINYNWQNKYIVNLTARRDGSSRFGSENLFHNFGSVAGAWLFSNESFIQKKLPILSFGKLGASYGTTGNDQIGDYQFMNLYNPYSVQVAYQGSTALTPAGLSNPYLQWEETRKLRVGLDLGFFKDRVLLNTNYYHNRSSNLLQGYALPIVTGFTNIQINFPATVQNTGWEFTLNTRNLEGKDFSWSSSINLTIPKNKLVAFPDLETSSYASVYVIGQPITIIKVFHSLGADPATGLYLFADKNGTPTPPPSLPSFSTDRTVLVNPDPKFYGGFQNSFRYKGFELDVLLQFTKQTAGNYLLGTGAGLFYTDNIFGMLANQPVWVLDRWKQPGDVTDVQKFISGFASPGYIRHIYATFSDKAFTDASYLRLKNVSLSWRLPEKWLQKAHLQNARIYIQGQNLLTITSYKGLDPEQPGTSSLPPLKILTLGLNMGL